jgi:Short C-terminal domain/zinc-ribbon domain
MALISCTECGQQISDKAAACPRCGSPASTSSHPIRDSVIQLEKALFDEVQNFSARIRELASSARRPSRPSASPSPDIPDQIRKLAKLKDDGIISSEEFEAKKTELLGKL